MNAFMARLRKKRELPTLAIIEKFLATCNKPYLAWSGGKDSTLMLWLALKLKPDIKVIYFDADSCLPDGKEYMSKLVNDWTLNFENVSVEPILDTLKKYGLDNKGLDAATMESTVYKPCRELQKQGYDGALVGVRAQENRGRRMAVYKHGACFEKTDGMILCWPMGYWTLAEIWAYFDYYRIPYHPAYDKTLFSRREDIRVSYAYGETFRTHGRFKWLQYYYPDVFNKFAAALPEVRYYV